MTREPPTRLRRAALTACCMGVLLLACEDPVLQTERALAKADPKGALRSAQAALKNPERPVEQRKRLFSLLIISAQRILDAADDDDVAGALTLFEAMPRDSEERARAAQRFLRVMARSGRPVEELDSALKKLEAEMGDEAALRSNLRSISVAARGTPASVWAAQTVVQRWPEEADRWLDLSAALAARGLHADASQAALTGLDRLHEKCAALPERMAGYDRVRRQSAYGQLEIQRCKGFPAFLLRAWAAALKQPEAPAGALGEQLGPEGAQGMPCPADAAAAPDNTLVTAESVVAVSPRDTVWWLDGRKASAPFLGVGAGDHVLAWRSGARCQRVTVAVKARTALVVRTLKLPEPPAPSPTASP